MFVQVLPIGMARVGCVYATDVNPIDRVIENKIITIDFSYEFIDLLEYYKLCIFGVNSKI